MSEENVFIVGYCCFFIGFFVGIAIAIYIHEKNSS